jgi:3-deoxy-manno-octulosonate cytidylyltransferase (CMP-KDO synthetase)
MILGIIPSRYASTRFPGKPLAAMAGKTMIERVYGQAKQSASLDKLIVATDDQRIFDHVKQFGGDVVMTRPDHPSGTDRCFEVLQQEKDQFQYVINIQGDEPFIDPGQIDELAGVLKDPGTELATLIIPVEDPEVLESKTDVKVVVNNKMEALYFSRQAIPFVKGLEMSKWLHHSTYYRHVGLYAYRRDILEKISRLPPSQLELAESLEQLRWLENGFNIRCAITTHESYSVDTPADLENVLRRLKI